MASPNLGRKVSPNPDLLPPEEERRVRTHLASILQSSPFRNSPRCQEFLSYVVESVLAGRRDQLKERLIGVQLFGRDASYDTGDDPIVRVKANEVRKRLAQFYEEAGAGDGVKITLPPGSYVPQFAFAPEAPPPAVEETPLPAPPAPGRRPRLAWLWLAVPLAAFVAFLLWPQPTNLDRFWAPLLDRKTPLLVSLGTSELLRLSPEAAKLAASAPKGKEITLPSSEIAFERNEFISIAHFRGLVEITRFCQRHGKPIEFRPGVELSADELRSAPILFVGAFSNAWTLRQNEELRFRFSRADGDLAIVDSAPGGKSWRIGRGDARKMQLDYALVTRLMGTGSQGPRILAGGLTRFGTQAALDFLSQPDYWRDAARLLPPGWEKRNLQLVLRVRLVSGQHSPAEIVAAHAW